MTEFLARLAGLGVGLGISYLLLWRPRMRALRREIRCRTHGH